MSENTLEEVDYSNSLDNPRHEKFARLAAKGDLADWECYQIAYDSSREVAETNAYRLRKDEGIRGRIKHLHSMAVASSVASKTEVMEFLTNAMRTPLSQITEHHPLAQEVDYKPDGSKKIKSVSKLGAVAELADLQGWKQDHASTVTAIQININAG